MQTVADMRGVGVKYGMKNADVLCGWPLIRTNTFICFWEKFPPTLFFT